MFKKFFKKIGKAFKSLGMYLHKLWLKRKPVILFMLKQALDSFKPILKEKIDQAKDKFDSREIASYVVGYAIIKVKVMFKNIPVAKQLIVGLLAGFEPKVAEMLQAKEDGVNSQELASDVIDRIYKDIKNRL